MRKNLINVKSMKVVNSVFVYNNGLLFLKLNLIRVWVEIAHKVKTVLFSLEIYRFRKCLLNQNLIVYYSINGHI